MAGDPDDAVTPSPAGRAIAGFPAGAFRSWLEGAGPIVGGGLKMFLSHRETLDYLPGLRGHPDELRDVQPFVLPTVTELDGASRILAGTGIVYGAQDCQWEAAGALTGAVSPLSLAELGCTLLEIGHAERLRWFGESWEVACRKTAAAVEAGLVPLVCVGEQHPTTPSLAADEVEAHLATALEAAGSSPVLVAYEPCWAIGADEAAACGHVAAVVERIRGTAGESAVLYGGSASRAAAPR
jgi:triosephosphate isomerase